MADISYSYHVVPTGNDIHGDYSANDTIKEIADELGIDWRILVELNPNLLTSRRIWGGPYRWNEKPEDGSEINPNAHNVYIGYKDEKNKVQARSIDFSTSFERTPTLVEIRNKLNDNWDKKDVKYKITTKDLLEFSFIDDFYFNPNAGVYASVSVKAGQTQKETLATDVHFTAGDKILTSVGSMTEYFKDFKTEYYEVDESTTNRTLEELAKILDKDAKTLADLNPMLRLTDKVSIGMLILISVTAESSLASVTVTKWGIQYGTTRTLYVEWTWDHNRFPTKHYEILWEYQTLDGQWWEAEKTNTSDEKTFVALHNPDEKATKVRVSIKPVSTIGDKYSYCTYQEHDFSSTSPLLIPSVSITEVKDADLTVSASVSTETLREGDSLYIQFGFVMDGYYPVSPLNKLNDIWLEVPKNGNGTVSEIANVWLGHEYLVRARSKRVINSTSETQISSWSTYAGPAYTAPVAPEITSIEAISDNQIQIHWIESNTATSYNVEYVVIDEEAYPNYTKEMYFSDPSIQPQTITLDEDSYTSTYDYSKGIRRAYAIVTIPTGAKFYIRMNAQRKDSEKSEASPWSTIETFSLGTVPDIPTTWSSTSNAKVGEPMKLYWMHNSEDGSIETSAKLELKIYSDDETYVTINRTITKQRNEDGDYETSYFDLNEDSEVSSLIANGAKIEWRVATAGAKTNNGQPVYGDFSTVREINIFVAPKLEMTLTNSDGFMVGSMSSNSLSSFPLNVVLEVTDYPNQQITGYYISIEAFSNRNNMWSNGYTTVGDNGNSKWVSQGDKIYSKHINAKDLQTVNKHTEVITAGDVNFENNVEYIVSASVTMDSGLSTIVSNSFLVGWSITDGIPVPNADVAIDKETLTATIMPYSTNKDNVRLSVYRREYDGSLTPLGTDINPALNTVVTDPHPSLNYARYRIVAKLQSTGASSYYDMPDIPVNEKAIIIQWNESWQSYNASTSDPLAGSSHNGTMLRLPYNIDIANNHAQDVSHVRYVGRKRPVSYYGTQLGETATWNTEIDKNDYDTLSMLRRLAIWMGDVYVREPSGSGYWATVTVNFSQKHRTLTIPVTLNITPVEGGM